MPDNNTLEALQALESETEAEELLAWLVSHGFPISSSPVATDPVWAAPEEKITHYMFWPTLQGSDIYRVVDHK